MKGTILLLPLCLISVVGAETQTCKKKISTTANAPRCPQWARNGASTTQFMIDPCPQSCNRRNRSYSNSNLLSLPQNSSASSNQNVADKAMERILRKIHGSGLDDEWQSDAKSCRKMLDQCTNLIRQRITESTCSTHSRYPQRYCAAACSLCQEMLHQNNMTCPLQIEEAPAFDSPNELFHRIKQQQQLQQYDAVSIHPSLIVIDDFLSDPESQALIDCAAARFIPSQDIVATRGRSYYYRARLSSRVHCDADAAPQSDVIANIYRRIEAMTLVPHRNTERMIEVVKYDVGHFHKPQSDRDGTAEPRALTILLFLSTGGGGALHFPETNVTILPRKARAVIWSNAGAFPSDDSNIPLAAHEMLPATEGVLYTAKIWIHARTVRTCKFIDDEQEMTSAEGAFSVSSLPSVAQQPEYAFA